MAKCAVTKTDEVEWYWQPFGPDEGINCFTLPGNHYRGFPVIKIGQAAKERIESGLAVTFTYKDVEYVASDGEVHYLHPS